jgi:hypothetical protein
MSEIIQFYSTGIGELGERPENIEAITTPQMIAPVEADNCNDPQTTRVESAFVLLARSWTSPERPGGQVEVAWSLGQCPTCREAVGRVPVSA